MANMGRNRMNSRYSVVNTPRDPTKIMMSTGVGWNMFHSAGRNARCRLVTMITNRSNHIPTVTAMETMKITSGLVRIALFQKTCGEMTLHEIIVQYAHQYGPKARFLNAYSSIS